MGRISPIHSGADPLRISESITRRDRHIPTYGRHGSWPAGSEFSRKRPSWSIRRYYPCTILCKNWGALSRGWGPERGILNWRAMYIIPGSSGRYRGRATGATSGPLSGTPEIGIMTSQFPNRPDRRPGWGVDVGRNWGIFTRD